MQFHQSPSILLAGLLFSLSSIPAVLGAPDLHIIRDYEGNAAKPISFSSILQVADASGNPVTLTNEQLAGIAQLARRGNGYQIETTNPTVSVMQDGPNGLVYIASSISQGARAREAMEQYNIYIHVIRYLGTNGHRLGGTGDCAEPDAIRLVEEYKNNGDMMNAGSRIIAFMAGTGLLNPCQPGKTSGCDGMIKKLDNLNYIKKSTGPDTASLDNLVFTAVTNPRNSADARIGMPADLLDAAVGPKKRDEEFEACELSYSSNSSSITSTMATLSLSSTAGTVTATATTTLTSSETPTTLETRTRSSSSSNSVSSTSSDSQTATTTGKTATTSKTSTSATLAGWTPTTTSSSHTTAHSTSSTKSETTSHTTTKTSTIPKPTTTHAKTTHKSKHTTKKH